MDSTPDAGTSGAIVFCSDANKFIHFEIKRDEIYRVPSLVEGKKMFCRTNHFLAAEVQPLTGMLGKGEKYDRKSKPQHLLS
jgi:hypothetical protein